MIPATYNKSGLTEDAKQLGSVQMVGHMCHTDPRHKEHQVSNTSKSITDISIRFYLLFLLSTQVDSEVFEQLFS